MRGVDLTNYALEDLLSFDDIFLDYFNNFLKNPTFAQPIQYNRYLGIFEEIDSQSNGIIQADRLPKHVSIRAAAQRWVNASGADPTANANNVGKNDDDRIDLNDVEQNKVFDWVRTERLPLFFRTDFFRDFKLCKLLTKSLDGDRPDSSASSQLIGGYSRQSPPISTSLSTEDPDLRTTAQANALYNSTSNLTRQFTFDADGDNENQTNFMELLTYFNQSDNDQNGLDLNLLERFNKMLFQRPGSRALSVPSFFPIASMNSYSTSNLLNKPSASHKKREETTKSTKSSFKNSSETETKSSLKRQDNLEDLSKDFDDESSGKKSGKKTIGFSLRQDSKDFNELNVRVENEESSHNLNNLEEDYDDVEFIVAEDENNNLNLKLEEHMSIMGDDLEQVTEADKIHASINQYKLKFLASVGGMNEFKEFLKPTSGYRLVKFWLDCEFYRDSMQDYDEIENMATRNRLFRDINEKYIFAFATKMHEKISKNYLNGQSLSHALFNHIQYDILRRLRSYWVPRFILSKLKVIGKDYGSFPLPPLTPDFGRQSTYMSAPSAGKTLEFSSRKIQSDKLTDEQRNIVYNKVKQALIIDKDAGGPFLRYISTRNPDKLPLILFWYDVCDFNSEEVAGYDRNSRLQHAWAIYNSYLSSTARFNIGIPMNLSEDAHRSLQAQHSSPFGPIDIDANIFQPVMEQIVPHLQDTWLEFIKDDIAKFTHAKLDLLRKEILEELGEDDDLTYKLPEPELAIENDQIYVKRPWVQEYLFKRSQSPPRPEMKKELSEQEKMARLLRRRKMEMERKKALKRALKRAKMEKLNALDEEMDDGKGAEEGEKEKKIRKGISFEKDRAAIFNRMFLNKTMILLFRKYFVDIGQRDWLIKFNSFVDAKAYLDQQDQIKRANSGTAFMKAYLEAKSKKNLIPFLSDDLKKKLETDMQFDSRGNNRPRTPFMSSFVREHRRELEEFFQKFAEQQALEHGLNSPEAFALLNPTELLVLLGDSYNPKDFDFDEEKGEGKMLPSKEDKAEFLKILYDWSIGKFSDRFFSFYAHLSEHGRKDGMPFLEKDLMFCVDSIRMKEISGDEVLRQKTRTVIDIYLDSSLPPSIQIDAPHDLHARLYKSSQKIMQGTHNHHDLATFDESKSHFYKELAPYWAGYKARVKDSGSVGFLTKQDKLLRERLDEFIAMKNQSPNDFRLPPLSPRSKSATPVKQNHQQSSQTMLGTAATGLSLPKPEKEPQSLNIVFSIATGIRIKDDRQVNTAATNNLVGTNSDRRMSRVSRASGSVLAAAAVNTKLTA